MEALMEALMKAMASVKVEDLLHDYRPFLVVYKDGRVHRFIGNDTVPPSTDPLTGVESKDVVISPETGVFVRIYKPQKLKEKVPLLIYFHGGGFCVESASSPTYHHYLNALSSQANIVTVSVDYRKAPEFPLPAAYDDSWSAINWVAKGGESWIQDHVDFSRVFFAGDSAGGNIAHHMAKRLAKNQLPPMKLDGVVLIHPFFWGEDRIGSEDLKMMKTGSGMGTPSKLWKYVCPDTSGSDDPMINPAMDPELSELSAERLMVCVAEQDALRDRGFHYKEAVVKSGWKGSVEVVETVGENHVFHLLAPTTQKAAEFMKQIASFLNSTPTTDI